MFFEFIKKHKTKTLLTGAGFLVVVGIVSIAAWVYFGFLVSRGDFFDEAPGETAVFWHRSAGNRVNETWLHEISRQMLGGQAAGQAQFLFDTVAPESDETAFAILPGFEDFIFWGRLDTAEFNTLKEKLEEMNFSYIFDDGGKVTVTNTKLALKEALATLSQKNFSLADAQGRLAAWNRAARRFPVQVYLGANFKWGNFPSLDLKSDFWGTNQLKVEKSGSGYNYLLATENDYLVREGENLLKNSLAVVFPEIKERKLPDETIVREIVANPEAFSPEGTQIAGREVKFFAEPRLNQEFLMFFADKRAGFSNSRDLLANFLVRLGREPDYYGASIIDLAKIWAKWLTSDFGGMVLGVDLE